MGKKTSSRDEEMEAVRAAKLKAATVFAELAVVNGIGITQKDGRYALKVNVEALRVPRGSMPTSIDGVPIVISETGNVHKQGPQD